MRERREVRRWFRLRPRTSESVAFQVEEEIGLHIELRIGVLIGAAIALASGPLLEPLLFETAGRDVLVVAAVAALLCAVALLASIVPAARAGRTDPQQALRSE